MAAHPKGICFAARSRGLVLVLAVAGWSRGVHAGNDDELFVGNQAAMVGGAVSATVKDASATWYNPAGLGAVERDQVDVSATVYTARSYAVPDFLSTVAGEADDGSVFEFVVAPAQLAYVRRLAPGLSLGLGYFVPRSQNYVLRESLDAGPPGERSEWQVAASVVETQHTAAAAIGHQVSQRVRLGAALIGGYNALQQSVTLFGAVQQGPDSAAANTLTTIGTSSRLTVELGLGMQLELSDAVVMGVTLRSPQLLLYALSNASSNRVVASDLDPDASSVDSDKDETVLEQSFEVLRAGRAGVSIGYVYGAGRVVAEIDLQPGWERPELNIDRRLLINARIGWYHGLSEAFALGVGLFTDRLGDAKRWWLLSGGGDFYGGTVGLEFSNEHLMAASERATSLIFSSVFALRYAYCPGEFGRIVADPDEIETDPFDTKKGSLRVHELGLYVGSGLRF